MRLFNSRRNGTMVSIWFPDFDSLAFVDARKLLRSVFDPFSYIIVYRCRRHVSVSHLFNILFFVLRLTTFSATKFNIIDIIHIFQFITEQERKRTFIQFFFFFSFFFDDVFHTFLTHFYVFYFFNKHSNSDTISTTSERKIDACDELQSEKFITWISLRGNCSSQKSIWMEWSNFDRKLRFNDDKIKFSAFLFFSISSAHSFNFHLNRLFE